MTSLLPIDSDQPKSKSASHGEAGYARNARDAYFTEPWVTQALLRAVSFRTAWPGTRIVDFVAAPFPWPERLISAVVTNPPFDMAAEFIRGAAVTGPSPILRREWKTFPWAEIAEHKAEGFTLDSRVTIHQVNPQTGASTNSGSGTVREVAIMWRPRP